MFLSSRATFLASSKFATPLIQIFKRVTDGMPNNQNQFKVLRPIIEAIRVDMVRLFTFFKGSSQKFLHHKAMLIKPIFFGGES
jgi:hypothetical protein